MCCGARTSWTLSPDELNRAKDLLQSKKIEVISIASPLLKCVLPNAPEVDTRFQQDIFASKHTYEDQPRLTDHAFEIAKHFGAKIIRVFSYWRTVEPENASTRSRAPSRISRIRPRKRV